MQSEGGAMGDGGPVIEDSGVVEDVYHLQLMGLFHELVRKKGNSGAASALGIDPRTVASCMRTGRLSWRVREALEEGLQSGAGSAAARQRARNDALESRIGELEGKLRSGLKEVREAVAEEFRVLREEQAKRRLHVERRLLKLEDGMSGLDSSSPQTRVEPAPMDRSHVPPRKHPQLVTSEAEPGEESVYGEATPVIVEWRKARAEFSDLLKTGTELAQEEARMRMLGLELVLIEEHELTLPPASYPWGWEERRDEARRRRRRLDSAEVDRNRALLRVWLRRILTFGAWRN